LQVDGAGRYDGVEGHAVLFGDDGQFVGADLIGDVAVGRGTVGADQYDVNLTCAQEMARGVIGDDVERNSALLELPGGEARTLQARPCLVYQHMNVLALLMRRENDAQSRAP